MDFTLTLVKLAGAVALLLWGIRMVQTGVQRAFGARLRGFLGTALRDRFRAFAAGIGVTAILQSSTATGLMVTGFAAGGLVDLVPALAVMLGANVGTTLIVQLLSFNVAEVAPVADPGRRADVPRASTAPRDFGRVLIGLGLLLMALTPVRRTADPVRGRAQPAAAAGRDRDRADAGRDPGRRADLGGAFVGRRRAGGDVLRRQGRPCRPTPPSPSCWGQSGHRHQPGAGRCHRR